MEPTSIRLCQPQTFHRSWRHVFLQPCNHEEIPDLPMPFQPFSDMFVQLSKDCLAFWKVTKPKGCFKRNEKTPRSFPQPSATTIDPFQFAALQLWFGRIEGIAEPWCGILKKDKPGKVAQLLKHPGWVHNVLFFEKIMWMWFYRYVPLHTELLWYRKSRLFLKKLTSAPWIHGQSFCCPATETAWNFKSFLRCQDG